MRVAWDKDENKHDSAYGKRGHVHDNVKGEDSFPAGAIGHNIFFTVGAGGIRCVGALIVLVGDGQVVFIDDGAGSGVVSGRLKCILFVVVLCISLETIVGDQDSELDGDRGYQAASGKFFAARGNF